MTSQDLNHILQSHFKISVNPSSNFPYSSTHQETIALFRHQELPQDYQYIDPRLSPNEKYLSVIGKGTMDDFVLIYDTDDLNEYKYKYKEGKIFGVDFAPDSRSFVIIYKNQPPIHYNISSGKRIISFKSHNKESFIPISSTFSAKCRFYGLAYDFGFCIWDALDGNLIKCLNEESDNKIIRENLLISINKKCNVKIINFQNDQTIKNFNIYNINYNDILAIMLSPDLEYIFIGLKAAIVKMEIETGKFENVITFKSEVSSIKLNEKCELAVSTNYKNIDFWNLKNKKNIGSILKDPFNSYTFNFSKEKLVIANDISISILNYNDGETEKFIWLNLNPEKFNYFSFSPDFKVLLAYIDEDNAILYNCENGEIIRKFQNNEKKYPLICEMVPSSSDFGVFAIKSDKNIVKIYNYINGVELMNLSGFNTYSFSFSEKGDLLSCGCLKGEEITRVWNLLKNEFYSYSYNGKNNNINTLVNITKSERPKIICVSEKQNPIIFDLISQELLFECDCPFIYEKVEKISSSNNSNFFIVKGMDSSGKSQCVVFSLEDGKLITQFNNCNCIHIGNGNLILSKSQNKNNGNLIISDLSDFDNIKEINCEINAEISNFLQDKKTIVSPFGSEEKSKFILTDVNNGEIIGNVEYEKIKGNHAEVDLSANVDDNTLIFTYIELVDRNLK